MSALTEDAWINQQALTFEVSEIEDCAIAVDATYYIQQLLDKYPSHEPLLPATGGLTGIEQHIQKDLDKWEANRVTPFFIFDGQSVIGEDEVTNARALKAIKKANEAWSLYFKGEAAAAVTAFGNSNGSCHPHSLYPMLQTLLKARKLFFLVPPYNAAAQIAYFEMIDSDQCGGIMGSQELLLYPIRDAVIKSIDWKTKTITAISKKQIMKSHNLSESMLIDAILMAGTSFLPTFPALLDSTMNPRQHTVMDAVNMLRTSDRSVPAACASFNDIVQSQDPLWLDKYFKARMMLSHFIYIAENGEVKVNDFDKLTRDNHEYLGLQLPSELYHYLNAGLVGPRTLSWITHCRITVLPTIDGFVSEEYKNLVTKQVVSIKEAALALIIDRLNRGIQHRDITMTVWFDPKFAYTVNHRNIQPSPSKQAETWNISEEQFASFRSSVASPGSIIGELDLLKNEGFRSASLTKGKEKGTMLLKDRSTVISLATLQLLHLRGYIDDSHQLTNWGKALARAYAVFEPIIWNNRESQGIAEAPFLAFELLRFGLLNTNNKHEELLGMPMTGSDDDRESLLLISRCAALLKLRHKPSGYTGPLSKSLLAFHSLCGTVRDADRELVEAIVLAMFMKGHVEREDDEWLIGECLPFLTSPDVAMAVAVKTFLDEVVPGEPLERREQRYIDFPEKFFPHATHFAQDINIACSFVGAMFKGVKLLGPSEVPKADRAVWDKTMKYLAARRLGSSS